MPLVTEDPEKEYKKQRFIQKLKKGEHNVRQTDRLHDTVKVLSKVEKKGTNIMKKILNA